MPEKPKTKDARGSRPSASYAELYDACNGSFLLMEQVPENERFSNEAAEAGTRMHAANEASDLSLLEDISEADIVERIREKERESFIHWADEYGVTDAEHHREKRLWFTHGGRRLFSGKLDYFAISPAKKVALVLDGKSGRIGATPSPRNLQLRAQAILLAVNHGVVKVRVGIAQPLAAAQPMCEYDTDSIYNKDGAIDQFIALVAAIENPDAKRTPGGHCAKCAACHICPEAHAFQSAVAKLEGLKWDTLDSTTKLQLWDRSKIAEKICAAIQQNVRAELAANPRAIPGLKKQPDKTMREVSDAIGIYLVLQKEFPGLEVEELNKKFNEWCGVTIGSIEKYYREVHPGVTQEKARLWFDKVMAGLFITKPRSGHVLREKN